MRLVLDTADLVDVEVKEQRVLALATGLVAEELGVGDICVAASYLPMKEVGVCRFRVNREAVLSCNNDKVGIVVTGKVSIAFTGV